MKKPTAIETLYRVGPIVVPRRQLIKHLTLVRYQGVATADLVLIQCRADWYQVSRGSVEEAQVL